MDEPSMEKHRTEKRKIGIYKSGTGDICGIEYFDGNNAKLKEEGI
jgi:hypothetical protein